MLGMAAILFQWSCDEPGEIGSELLDPALVETLDGVEVELRAVPVDSFQTDENVTLYLPVFGAMNDPVSGKIQSDLYAQFVLERTNESFAPAPYRNLRLDSAFLVLNSIDYEGDPNARLPVSVKEISLDFDENKEYFSVDEQNVFEEELAVNGEIGLADPEDFSSQFHYIRLSDAFGQHLLDAPADRLETADAYSNYFQGLKIAATPPPAGETGLMLDLNIGLPLALAGEDAPADTSGVRLFYKADTAVVNGNDTTWNTASFEYRFRARQGVAASYTALRREIPAGTPLADMADTTQPRSREEAFVQCNSAVTLAGKVFNPELLEGRAINRAELTLYALPRDTTAGDFDLLNNLFFFEARQSNPEIPNDSLAIRRGASRNTADDSYTFDVTVYMQDVALGRTNAGFVILPTNILQLTNCSCTNSVRFGNRLHPDKPPRLRILTTPRP